MDVTAPLTVGGVGEGEDLAGGNSAGVPEQTELPQIVGLLNHMRCYSMTFMPTSDDC